MRTSKTTRLLHGFLAVASSSILFLSGCAKIVPKPADAISFVGLNTVRTGDAGQFIFSWAPPVGLTDSALSVSYEFYLQKVSNSDTSVSSSKELKLVDGKRPADLGVPIKTLTATSFVIDRRDGLLEVGQTYAAQVEAVFGEQRSNTMRVMTFSVASAPRAAGFVLEDAGGNFQLCKTETVCAKGLTAKLLRNGEPVNGEQVSFSILTGGGTLSAAETLTDAKGEASIAYTPGADAGTSEIQASWHDSDSVVKFMVLSELAAGSSMTLSIVSGNFQLQKVLETFDDPLLVKLTQGGKPIAHAKIDFSVTRGTGASLSSAQMETNDQGETAVVFTAGNTPGAFIVHAAYQGLAIADFQLLVNPPPSAASGATTDLTIVSGNAQTANVSVGFALPLKVRLLEGSAPIVGEVITWSATGASGSSAVLSTTSTTTNAQGAAQVNLTAGPAGGTVGVTATWAAGSKTATFIMFINDPNPALAMRALTMLSGNFQTGNLSDAFATPLVVRATNNGVAVSGESVTFVVSGCTGGAMVSSASVVTDVQGKAHVNFTAGTAKGTCIVTATWTAYSAAAQFAEFVVDPVDAVTLDIVSGNAQSGTISTVFAAPLKIRLNNAGAAFAGQTVNFSVTTGTGASVSNATRTTDVNGDAQVTFTAGATVGLYEVTASWSSGARTKTFSLNGVDPSNTRQLEVVSGNFQTGNMSAAFASPLVVKASNNGAALAGESISFAVSGCTGTPSVSSAAVTTDALGKAQVTFTGGTVKGTCIVTATWTTYSISQQFALFVLDPLDSVTLALTSGSSQVGPVSAVFAAPLKIQLLNGGAAYAGQTINFAITTGVGATLSAASQTTDVSGNAQVNLTAGSAIGLYEVTASWSGGAKSVVFSMSADASADLRVLEIVGGNFQIGPQSDVFTTALQIKLSDNGVAMAGQTISWSVSASPTGSAGHAVSVASSVTNASGLTQVTFSGGDKIGTYEITASAFAGAKTVKFAEIAQVVSNSRVVKIVAAGAGNQTEVTTASVDVASGYIDLKAAAYDLNTGNYLEDVAVNWSLVGGGFNSTDFIGSTSGAISIRFDPTRTGVTTVQATYAGADTRIVGVTDTTGFLTVNAALVPAVITVFSGDNQSAVVGNTLATALTVYVTSAGGVAVPGFGVLFTAAQGGGQLSPNTAVVTDANGKATVTATLGTVAMGNIFRATMVDYPALQADFSATATVGAANRLVFSSQPGSANKDIVFGAQPVVSIRDQYNNLVTTGAYTITLARSSGTGALAGTVAVATVNGAATFTNVQYSVQENNVTIGATSSPALTAATSSTFIVGAPWPGACLATNGTWTTALGGCRHTSGLIFSGVAQSTMPWDDMVWGSALGSNNGTQDAYDLGRTNDYGANWMCGGSVCNYFYPDVSGTNYCHSLVEGGYSDWRAPSQAELQSISGSTPATNLTASATSAFWTNTPGDGTTTARSSTVVLSSGVLANSVNHSSSNAVICVRGKWGSVSGGSLVVAQAPDSACLVAGTSTYGGNLCDFKVAVKDTLNNSANVGGIVVTLSISAGTISGKTATTDEAGIATFDSLNISDSGSLTITATAPNLMSVSQAVTVKTSGSSVGCRSVTPSGWTSANGGCENTATHIVYSQISPTKMTWSDAIWDANLDGVYDASHTDDDYDNDPTTTANQKDMTNVQYCHDLVQGGKTDWRMATSSEMSSLANSVVADRPLPYEWGNIIWTSTTLSSPASRACRMTLAGSGSGCSSGYVGDGSNSKTNSYYVICVRP